MNIEVSSGLGQVERVRERGSERERERKGERV